MLTVAAAPFEEVDWEAEAVDVPEQLLEKPKLTQHDRNSPVVPALVSVAA